MVKTIAPANKEPYYISLTINDDAIGWCVLNKDYTLQRAKGKDMWGTRELGIAETSADCRLRRASRRSLKREKQESSIYRRCSTMRSNQSIQCFLLALKKAIE